MNTYYRIEDLEHHEPDTPMAVDGIWLPSEWISCHTVKVPKVARKKWLSMMPWLLDEQVLAGVDDVEYACGSESADMNVPVLVLAKTVLRKCRDKIPTDTVTPSEFVPDFFGLPWHREGWSVAVMGKRSIFRCGEFEGGAAPREAVWALIARENEKIADKVHIYTDNPSEIPGELKASSEVSPLDGIFAFPKAPWLGFQTSEPGSKGQAKNLPLPFQLSAVCLLMVAILSVGNYMLTTKRIASQASYLEERLAQVYQEYFLETYDSPMEIFRDKVAGQTGSASAGEESGLVGMLAHLPPIHEICRECRVLSVSGDDSGVQMRIEGSLRPQEMPSLTVGDLRAELEKKDDYWLFRIGKHY